MVIGIGPAWSLAVEVVFYCILPLLVLAAARAARLVDDRRGRVLVLLGPPLLLLCVGLSGKYAAHLLPGSPLAGYKNDWHSVIERSFWAQADLFSFGMVVAVVYTEVSDGRLVLPLHWRRLTVALGLLVFLPCAATIHQGEQSYLVQNTGEALGIALLFAALMLPDPATTKPCPNWPDNVPALSNGFVTVEVFCAPPGSGAADSAFTKCPLPDDPAVPKTTYGPEDRVHWPAGSYLKVRATLTIGRDNPIIALGRGINGLFSSLGMGKPFPDQMHLTDASVAIIE